MSVTGAVIGQVIALADEVGGDSTGAVLGQGDMPVFVPSDAFGQTAQKTVDFPQLPFAVFLRPCVSGRLWTFLEDDFWKVSVFNTSWFDSGYMLRQFTEAFWVSTAENCGVSAVAVHRWSSIVSCRGAEADSHGLAVHQTTVLPGCSTLTR